MIKDKNSIYFNGHINKFSIEELINELLKMEISIKNNNKPKLITNSQKIKNNLYYIKSIFIYALCFILEFMLGIENINKCKVENVTIEPETEIKLYIVSYGGCVHNAFNIIDVIKSMEIPVHTICKGFVASAGTLISLSGKKRFITKHSYMLIHELRTGCWGNFSYIKDDYFNSHELMNCIKNYYVENTKLNMEELELQLKQDVMWNATNCLKNGLVDEIL